jgi:hypothetical protein
LRITVSFDRDIGNSNKKEAAYFKIDYKIAKERAVEFPSRCASVSE